MIEPSQLLLFALAGWLLNLTPGPDVLYIVGQSLRGGRRAGLAAVAGITAGCFVHVTLAALGLGVLLATSAWLFDLVKWVGAATCCGSACVCCGHRPAWWNWPMAVRLPPCRRRCGGCLQAAS